MSVNLSQGLSISQGNLGGSISGDILSLSLSVPVHPAISIGGSVFLDLSNGGSIIGGSFDIKILKFFNIKIGRKGCTEYITISIGWSAPKSSGKSNSRNNGKNDHGGRTNQRNNK